MSFIRRSCKMEKENVLYNNPLVSIITVCYNSANTIEDTIRSVLEQTYRNIEYIIVDGKSTDSTMSLVKKYETLFEGRLHYISEKDDGIYDAMNKGIEMAGGELIGIINSDDYYELDAVENIVKQYKHNKEQVLYGMMRIIEGDQERRIVMDSHHFIREVMIPHCTCFVKREIYIKYGKFDLRYKYVADYDLMLRLSQIKDITFTPVYVITSNFRVGGASSCFQAVQETLKFKLEKKLISRSVYVVLYIRELIRKWVGA